MSISTIMMEHLTIATQPPARKTPPDQSYHADTFLIFEKQNTMTRLVNKEKFYCIETF